jgi:hypothetical protein
MSCSGCPLVLRCCCCCSVLQVTRKASVQSLFCCCRYELQWMSPGAEMRLLLGGSCLAFCPAATAHEEVSLVVVGPEGGRLLRCQVRGTLN